MPLKILYISIAAFLALIMADTVHASPDIAKVTYQDGKHEVFHLNRDASLIRRVLFDSANKNDRMVVTYRDDTHQVFKLKERIVRIKSIVLEGGDKVELPPRSVPTRPAESSFEPATAGAFVPSDINLGSSWQVTEKCGNITWKGIWTRRGASNIFDARWSANTGDKLSAVIEFRNISGGRMTLHRSDKGGAYTGTLSEDKKRVINGWATWYAPNCLPWYAVID